MAVDRLAEVRALFEPDPASIYLDSATYGLPPRPTVDAMHAAISDWQSGTANWVHDWDTRGENCRAAFAALTGVSTDCVALLPSVSAGVGTVAGTAGQFHEVRSNRAAGTFDLLSDLRVLRFAFDSAGQR